MTTHDTTPRVPWRTALARTLDRDKLLAYLTRTGWDRRDEPGCAVFTKLADGEPDNYYEAVVPLADTRDRHARLMEVLATLDVAENRPISDIARDVMRGEGARYAAAGPNGPRGHELPLWNVHEPATQRVLAWNLLAADAESIAAALNAAPTPQATDADLDALEAEAKQRADIATAIASRSDNVAAMSDLAFAERVERLVARCRQQPAQRGSEAIRLAAMFSRLADALGYDEDAEPDAGEIVEAVEEWARTGKRPEPVTLVAKLPQAQQPAQEAQKP